MMKFKFVYSIKAVYFSWNEKKGVGLIYEQDWLSINE